MGTNVWTYHGAIGVLASQASFAHNVSASHDMDDFIVDRIVYV